MYKEYYGLTHYPFSKEIDSCDLFIYKGWKEYQARMELLKRYRGFGLIYGPPGSGKSVGLRWLRDNLNKNLFRFFYLTDPPGSVSSFYRQLALAMDLQPAYHRIDLYYQLQNYLTELVSQKRITPIIALDECQMYPYTVLESLRMLLNFDIDSRHYVIVLLAGQPELKRRLKLAVYEPITQRIVVHYAFSGIGEDELENYLRHRLNLAGRNDTLFTAEATQAIYQIAKGILRKIDILADKALWQAASKKLKTVDRESVITATEEVLWK